jgi:hypothetical protein
MEAWTIPIIFVAFLAVISTITTIILSLTIFPTSVEVAATVEREAIIERFSSDITKGLPPTLAVPVLVVPKSVLDAVKNE